MGNIRKFRIGHNDNVVSFDIEIDLSKKQSMDMSCYEYDRYGESVKSDILCSSLFWSGSPREDDKFEDHLNFFVKSISNIIADFAVTKSCDSSSIHDMLNNEEGYYPVFGDAVKVLNVTSNECYITDYLYIGEIK